MPDNAVFISYAREDLPAVQRLKAGARRRRHHAPGSTSSGSKAATTTTARSSATSRAARSSSRSSRRRPSGASRATSGASGATRSTARATSPTARSSSCRSCIDDTDQAARAVPEKFRRVHITRLPGGEPARAGVRSQRAAASCSVRRRARERRPTMPSRRERGAAHPRCARTSSTPRIPGSASPRSPRRRARYFHGRDEEVAELARRVQRKLLTVLFGQSGLGKTSILRAGHRAAAAARGLLPGLRAHRLLARVAAAVRADQAGDLPRDRGLGPVDAAGRGRSRANRSGSSCTIATTCCATPSGKTLMPLLIFDQFEEIFTLGAGRRLRAPARRAVPRRPRRPRREPPARGARSADRQRRDRSSSASTSRAPTTAS